MDVRATSSDPIAAADGATSVHSSAGGAPVSAEAVVAAVRVTLAQQGGVVFAHPTIVHRVTYSGRGIIAPNTAFTADMTDDRGYVPVERWIMSMTEACNPVPRAGEGLSTVLLRTPQPASTASTASTASSDAADGPPAVLTCTLKHAVEAHPDAARLLLGACAREWPLTKVLDIGGNAVRPTFTAPTPEPAPAQEASATNASGSSSGPPTAADYEVPGIPCHVHAGTAVDGACDMRRGKLEAYFFPPVDVPPYSRRVPDLAASDAAPVVTRLGLATDAKPDDVVRRMAAFGRDDSMYAALRRWPVHPYDSWTIQPGIIHAPGPYPTFEIQRAQDDCNLLAWRLGERLEEEGGERASVVAAQHLAGLADHTDVLRQAVDWDGNVDPGFEAAWRRRCLAREQEGAVLASGSWGRRLRIFWHQFYGEAIEVAPGATYTRPAASEPWAAIVWSGAGSVNGMPLHDAVDGQSEFLVTPGHEASFTCAAGSTTGDGDGAGAGAGAGASAGAGAGGKDASSGGRMPAGSLLVYAVFPIREGVA